MQKRTSSIVLSVPLLLAIPSFQDPHLEKPPLPTGPRHPKTYNFDSSSLADRLAEKLEKAPNRDVLRWAIVQLGLLGDDAIPALRRAFYRNFSRSENFPTLNNICEALGQTKSFKAVPILLDGASHPSGVVRSRAVDSLVNIKDPSSFPHLRALFPIETKEYKTRLLDAMASLGSSEFVPFVEELMKTQMTTLQDLSLQYIAEKYLSEGEPLLRSVFSQLGMDPRKKLVAAMGLVQRGDLQAKAYLEKAAAEEPSFDERIKAMFGLGAAHAIESLIPFREASEAKIRVGLVQALGVSLSREQPMANTEETKKRALELLHALSKDLVPGVRTEAIKQLVRIGERTALDPFLDVLANETHPERLKEAVELIIDPNIRELRAVPILVKRVKTASLEQQKIFLQALGALHDERGVEPMLDCLVNPPQDRDLAYQEFAALQVGFLGKPAVKPLIKLSKETRDGLVRYWATQALVWTQDPEAAEFLLERIADPQEDRRLRLLLIGQIPKFGGLSAAGTVKRMLSRETDPELRMTLNELLWDYY